MKQIVCQTDTELNISASLSIPINMYTMSLANQYRISSLVVVLSPILVVVAPLHGFFSGRLTFNLHVGPSGRQKTCLKDSERNDRLFLDSTHYPLPGHLSIKQERHDGFRSLDA